MMSGLEIVQKAFPIPIDENESKLFVADILAHKVKHEAAVKIINELAIENRDFRAKCEFVEKKLKMELNEHGSGGAIFEYLMAHKSLAAEIAAFSIRLNNDFMDVLKSDTRTNKCEVLDRLQQDKYSDPQNPRAQSAPKPVSSTVGHQSFVGKDSDDNPRQNRSKDDRYHGVQSNKIKRRRRRRRYNNQQKKYVLNFYNNGYDEPSLSFNFNTGLPSFSYNNYNNDDNYNETPDDDY